MSEIIKINILEAASEIADYLVKEELSRTNIQVFEENADGTMVYTNVAQDIFNAYYDTMYNQLYKIKEE